MKWRTRIQSAPPALFLVFTELRSVFSQHPVSTAVFLSPPIVMVGTSVAENFACRAAYVEDPHLGLWHSLLWLAVSAALVQLNPRFCQQVVGKDPPFGTQMFALIFVSLSLNALLCIPLLIVYRVIAALVGAPC